jgi:hypothetical protein
MLSSHYLFNFFCHWLGCLKNVDYIGHGQFQTILPDKVQNQIVITLQDQNQVLLPNQPSLGNNETTRLHDGKLSFLQINKTIVKKVVY